MRKILITGAAGRVGAVLRKGLKRPDRIFHLLDIADLGAKSDDEILIQGDATRFDVVMRAVRGVDTVVHLAAYPLEADWATIFPLNYQMTYNVFEAARLADAKRVIFASSIQAVGFHPIDRTIDDSTRLRPSGFYGVSKGFGECMASLYADKFGLSVACLRIASFEERPLDQRMLATWLSYEDGVHLFDRCIDADNFHFVRVYGVSNNDRAKVDNTHVDWLGYRPKSNAEAFVDEVLAKGTPLGPLARITHGGDPTDMDFNGTVEDVLSN